MTGEYTFVAPERQNELTRRIQEKLLEAANKRGGKSEVATPHEPGPVEVSPNLAETRPVTSVLQ